MRRWPRRVRAPFLPVRRPTSLAERAFITLERVIKGGLFALRYLSDREVWLQQVEQLFYDLRQPDWWQGRDAYHPPDSDQPVSRLQAALQRGEFVVTAEIAPPLLASGESVQRTADSLRPFITARSVRAAHCLAKGDFVPVIEVDPDTGWLQVWLPGSQQSGWISGKPAYVSIK